MNTKVWYLPYFEDVYHTRMRMHVWYVWLKLNTMDTTTNANTYIDIDTIMNTNTNT